MKLNQKLIKQLRDGEIAVENSGTVEQLREVLKAAFPEDTLVAYGESSYYYLSTEYASTKWDWGKTTNLPTVKISEFYQPELFTGWAKDDSVQEWMGYFKDDIQQFGFNAHGDWKKQLCGIMYSDCSLNRPATHEEILSALTKYAKKKGYKKGITCLFGEGKRKGVINSNIFKYKPDFFGDAVLLLGTDILFTESDGQWAEIVEQPKPESKTNPIKYLVEGIEYSLDYQDLKAEYNKASTYTDDEFLANLPQIAHLACVVAYFKGLGVQATISDVGIVHELIHLMTNPEEPTNKIYDVRVKFNKLIRLV